MRSSFFEFSVATTALHVARANLEVASHNVANSEIRGYSRQYAEQRASRPMAVNNGKGMVGTGAEVYGIGQIRDFYLDKKYWAQRSVLGEYSTKQTHLSIMELVLNEWSDTGVNSAFNDFFNGLQSLSTSTDEKTYRTSVIQIGQTLTTFINTVANDLKKQQVSINDEVKSVVSEINSLGRQISNLNKQIFYYEADGSKANDLRDERARLVDELSLYVNVEVNELEMNDDYAAGLYPEPEQRGKSEKQFSVMINGYDFVNHFNFSPLEVKARTADEAKNPMDAAGMYDIYFSGSNSKFDIYSPTLKGELKGLIDVRDGNNGNYLSSDKKTVTYKGIPHYMNRLNELVRTFARAIDEGKDAKGNSIPNVIGHLDGFDEYGNTGVNRFFTYSDYDSSKEFDYSKLNCFNFTINPDLVEDPKLLACEKSNNLGVSNNEVILSFLNIKQYDSLFSNGKLSDYIISISGDLSIDLNQANRFEESYSDVTLAIDNQRIQVSGVDINEEFANILKFQHLYQAAAKLINVIDSIYTTMISLGA